MAPASEHKSRNYDVGGGVMRFTKSRMYKKRAAYRWKKAGLKKLVDDAISGKGKKAEEDQKTSRTPRHYPTQEAPRKLKNIHKKPFSKHTHKIRASITPGTVLILLAGRHKGKRVVFLKQLNSGMLLVTGPYKVNGCPMRRVNQRYVIGTQTKLDISGLQMAENLNDDYFNRSKLRKPKHTDGEIFDQQKEAYSVSDERKADQKTVDAGVVAAIKKHPQRKHMFAYLRSLFSLSSKTYPHKLVF